MLIPGKEAVGREVSLSEARLVAWSESVPADHCLRVTVGAQGDGAGVELRAFDAADDEVDRAQAAHAVSVRACARADAGQTVRFELRGGPGHLDAVLGERVEPLESP
jgi:hypothetical protein